MFCATTLRDDLQLLIGRANLGHFNHRQAVGRVENELVTFRCVRIVVEVECRAAPFFG